MSGGRRLGRYEALTERCDVERTWNSHDTNHGPDNVGQIDLSTKDVRVRCVHALDNTMVETESIRVPGERH